MGPSKRLRAVNFVAILSIILNSEPIGAFNGLPEVLPIMSIYLWRLATAKEKSI